MMYPTNPLHRAWLAWLQAQAALLILTAVWALWGGIKLEQWATAHNAARLEAE